MRIFYQEGTKKNISFGKGMECLVRAQKKDFSRERNNYTRRCGVTMGVI